MSQAMVISGADVAIVDLNSRLLLNRQRSFLLNINRGGGSQASR
jgi:hypothetical protein